MFHAPAASGNGGGIPEHMSISGDAQTLSLHLDFGKIATIPGFQAGGNASQPHPMVQHHPSILELLQQQEAK